MRKERVKKVKRRLLYCESNEKTKIRRDDNTNRLVRARISELFQIILSEDK